MDIVVQPMQRLTKYSLLLKAIQKNTENEEDQESLAVMVSELQTLSLWKYKSTVFHVQICQCINITEPGEPGTTLSFCLSLIHTHTDMSAHALTCACAHMYACSLIFLFHRVKSESVFSSNVVPHSAIEVFL